MEQVADNVSIYKLAIDIEAVSNTNVNAIGMVAVDCKHNFVFEKSYYIKVKADEIDPLCKTRFWDQQNGLLEKFQELGKPEEEVIKEFVYDYDNLHLNLGVSQNQIKLYSDNPEYDFGRLSPYVKKHCNRDPLRYCLDGSYRKITDMGSFLNGNGYNEIVTEMVNKIVQHDHEPKNDAKHILLKFILAEKIQECAKPTQSIFEKALETAFKQIGI